MIELLLKNSSKTIIFIYMVFREIDGESDIQVGAIYSYNQLYPCE